MNIRLICYILHNMILEVKERIEGLNNIVGNLFERNILAQRALFFDGSMTSTMVIVDKDTQFESNWRHLVVERRQFGIKY